MEAFYRKKIFLLMLYILKTGIGSGTTQVLTVNLRMVAAGRGQADQGAGFSPFTKDYGAAENFSRHIP